MHMHIHELKYQPHFLMQQITVGKTKFSFISRLALKFINVISITVTFFVCNFINFAVCNHWNVFEREKVYFEMYKILKI